MKATPMTYGTKDVLNSYLVKEQEKIHEQYLIVCNHLEGDMWKRARDAAYKYRNERWLEIEREKAQLRYAATMSNVNGNAETREFWGVDEALAASANLDTLKTPTQTQGA